jgi:O-6-methylguanine DNA methyltransferase
LPFSDRPEWDGNNRLYFAETARGYNGLFFHLVAWEDKLLHFTFSSATHRLAKAGLRNRYPAALFSSSDRLGEKILERFGSFAEGREKTFSPPFHPLLLDHGTSFQRRVWRLLTCIPYGETRTYGELARELGGSGYARAVGRACHANPLALIIPCHRVVAAQGLGGFNGGGEVKERLLAMEKRFSG